MDGGAAPMFAFAATGSGDEGDEGDGLSTTPFSGSGSGTSPVHKTTNPEPASFVMIGLGFSGLAVRRFLRSHTFRNRLRKSYKKNL
jgi:hypothetical protein